VTKSETIRVSVADPLSALPLLQFELQFGLQFDVAGGPLRSDVVDLYESL
jgi:hypothetical protein|tara:strand:- start:6598 stop:6747 length:150 start_codon:yes stop_codon:yes gene_type:complete